MIADVDGHLAEALVHFGRGGWFDLFKAIECIEDWAGGERPLKGLGWIEPSEFTRIKRTANFLRPVGEEGILLRLNQPHTKRHRVLSPCCCARRSIRK